MSETIYHMDTVQKNLLDNFMQGRNQALLFSKGNVGADGKPTIVDPDTNRPRHKMGCILAIVYYQFSNCWKLIK